MSETRVPRNKESKETVLRFHRGRFSLNDGTSSHLPYQKPLSKCSAGKRRVLVSRLTLVPNDSKISRFTIKLSVKLA